MTYPKTGGQGVPSTPAFPAIELDVLDYWRADGTFQASIDQRDPGVDGANEFVFYDGPPFANGLPHYGHLLTGYVKDVVPRYQTMRGRRVERRFGWDCHGLPAEVEAEKQLGIGHKAEIEAMGIAAFNDACRTSVLRYTRDWQQYVERQARWVDFDNDYKTLDADYMESVMWAFKTLWDKGLVYEGFRVLAYCWRCETPLSNTETRMDDVYRQRQDPALTVGFRLETGERALAWTTTPWTLPSNLAVAVNPDVDYVVVAHAGERYLLAEARLGAYERELSQGEIVERVRGAELVGRRYEPMFDFLTDTERFGTENAFRILAGDFVTTEDGTGLVHMAPAYGEADQNICAAAGIPVVLTVDDRARFTSVAPPFEGQHVFEANKAITADLKSRDLVLRHETYEHPYPHCWRCDNPLIYKAVSSWFVQVTKVRDQMVALNQQISWTPAHIRDGQFGKWLAHARDWSISRNRYWGSPIPVWQSDDPEHPRTDVYGSVAELERDFGVQVSDLHRPFVDELTRPNPDDPSGRSTMRRVREVLDCWFESGSMPFAQVHYPFENTDWFEHHYPGDFIVEYTPQTRGWFYTMHVLATALFDRPAFKSCLVHGTLLGSDGRKMSKSLGNYPVATEVIDRDGSDAMRWFLMSSPVMRGGEFILTEQGIREGVRQVLIPLWNAWSFFSLYANVATPTGAYDARWRTDSQHVLDGYLIAKTRELVETVTEQLDAYDVAGACGSIRAHVEMLTNWYVRRSRQRFWAGDTDALDTLWTALHVLTRVAAPLAPLTTEAVHRGLTGDRSVHLTDWPDPAALPADAELVAAMDAVRDVCSAALSVRKAEGLRVRLPLSLLTIGSPDSAALTPYRDLLRDEVNVRDVVLTGVDDAGIAVKQRLVVLPRTAGPRLGKDVQTVIRASKSGDWAVTDEGLVAGGIGLRTDEFELETVVSTGHGDNQAITVLPAGGFVALDTVVTPELAAEGLVRDLVRVVQQARRDAGLHISDRIRLGVDAGDEVNDAVNTHRDLVTRETLATVVELGAVPADRCVDATVGDGHAVRVTVERTG